VLEWIGTHSLGYYVEMSHDERAERWVGRYIEDCRGAQCKLWALNALIREAEFVFKEIMRERDEREARSRVR
jgi:hypothetical protein